MIAPVFHSEGLDLPSGILPPLALPPAGVALWQVRNDHHAREALDAVFGLSRVPSGGVVWFGRDLAGTSMGEILPVLRRLAPVPANGGLIGNINVCENILLPCMERTLVRDTDPVAELEALLAMPPWSGLLTVDNLTALPHSLTDPSHVAAGLLRAYLCRPDTIVAADIFGLLDKHERQGIELAVAWMRRNLPACAWLFLLPERSLPRGFDETNLPSTA